VLDGRVAELSGLLRALLPPSPIVEVPAFELDITAAPSQGQVEAKAIVVEFSNYAKAVGLDEARFQACMEGGAAAARVRADLAEAERLNLTATPAFLIGEATPAGAVRITRRVDGAHPLPIFQAAIEGVLAGPRSDAK